MVVVMGVHNLRFCTHTHRSAVTVRACQFQTSFDAGAVQFVEAKGQESRAWFERPTVTNISSAAETWLLPQQRRAQQTGAVQSVHHYSSSSKKVHNNLKRPMRRNGANYLRLSSLLPYAEAEGMVVAESSQKRRVTRNRHY